MRVAMVLLSILAAANIAAGPAAADPRGPDVSSWQHGGGRLVDWFGVRAAGHDFAMVKATEGLHYVNPFFVPDSLIMRTAGVARGVYHYARPRQSPELQAAFFAATVLGENGPLDLPPVLDLEKSEGLAPAALIDWTRRYLAVVATLTGRAPIIYTYPNFWRKAMANTTEFSQYPLWIADYNGRESPGPLPGGWRTWTFWQHTDCGRVPGIAGCVDVNVYNGPHDTFRRLANMPTS
ncbi:MAG: glycoside hydrolase family 25 protein [Mycobacteriaceae bacterium]|nr:glycoside hydrolase family 25 protein [Mycobacteriaceae bacterium]